MSSGWIILDKAPGSFSRAITSRVGQLFGEKKSGHVGTLDPMATGVLPVAIGSATKMIAYIQPETCGTSGGTKEYKFSLQFGFQTDTLDTSGKVQYRSDIIPTDEQIRAVCPKFIGEITQIPPIYSAIHVAGKRAYELARNGKFIDLAPRRVNIYDLKYDGFDGKSWQFTVRCGIGTYVRSLARDIAKLCGSVATVDMIRRTETNGFMIKDAVTLDFLENLVNNGGDIEKYLMPTDTGLGGIPVLCLDDKDIELYRNGGFIPVAEPTGVYRVYHHSKFVGIGFVEDKQLRPRRTI